MAQVQTPVSSTTTTPQKSSDWINPESSEVLQDKLRETEADKLLNLLDSLLCK